MNGGESSNSIGLNVVDIPVIRGVYILISEDKEPSPEEGLEELSGLPNGWRGKRTPSGNNSPIRYTADALEYGLHPLSLFEMKRYVWRLHSDQEGIDLRRHRVSSSLENTGKADWIVYTHKKESPRGAFRVCNYLGTANLSVIGMPAPVKFDILTEKIGFADEYRSMVEMIAGCCQQLLLDWGSPTSLNFSSDAGKKSQILLEQFLFLRSILGSDKLAFYLEMLQRNPHNMLKEETSWHPLGVSPARGFLRNPVSGGKNWMASYGYSLTGCRGMVPSEVLDSRKFESMDTPPNRFVKFALESFSEVCHEVISSFIQKDPGAAAVIEAGYMLNILDSFLASPFFADVGPMRRVPHESQTLQKREGYRQILQAWLMLDAAAQLDWPGREDAYDGTTRNVALLYEYWLYFTIYRLLKDDLKLEEIEIGQMKRIDILPFIARDSRGLRISLKQGKTSLCVFQKIHADGSKLRIHFYYNRAFCPTGRKKELLACGSYTHIFRPDYTLVIFPDEYAQADRDPLESEALAEKKGHIAYLHFDAKFRVELLNQLFGKEYKSVSEEESEIPADIQQQLDAEHQETSIADIYKRGDLYKMHTYNDAIRRTVGSYVLYPGKDKVDAQFSRYHEILPGVGAFTLRPDFVNGETTAVGTTSLKEFIEDVLLIQKNLFSQLYRVNYWTHETIKEPPGIYTSDGIVPDRLHPPADTEVLAGWVRDEGTGQIAKEKRLFYFHAVEDDGKVTKLDPRVFRARYIIPYTEKTGLGWYAPIEGCRLVSGQDLIDKIGGSHNCIYYYLLTLGEPVEMQAIELTNIIVSLRDRRPIVTKWDKLFMAISTD